MRYLLLLVFLASQASAEALTDWGTLGNPPKYTAPACMVTAKGQATNLLYEFEIDGPNGL
jgi:hypothetical protein